MCQLNVLSNVFSMSFRWQSSHFISQHGPQENALSHSCYSMEVEFFIDMLCASHRLCFGENRIDCSPRQLFEFFYFEIRIGVQCNRSEQFTSIFSFHFCFVLNRFPLAFPSELLSFFFVAFAKIQQSFCLTQYVNRLRLD